jgi:alkylation response protein AidB-like acyl-CoA dehydrogenase
MNFNLTDDQRALVDTVEKFAASTSATGPYDDGAEASVADTIAHWQQMAELGMASLLIAEADGGLGMSMADAVLVCEALGQNLAQEPFITAAVVAPKLVEMCVFPDVRTLLLSAIGDGRARIAIASDEAILDLAPENLSAYVEQRDGVLRLSGVKNFVVDGATATHFLVTAHHDGSGPNAFLVPADRAGVVAHRIRGLNGGWLAQVVFDGATVDAPLFDSGTAMSNIERAIDHGIVSLCAEALGLMNRMLALTAGYLQARHQFGKPIGTFQALQHRFAEMVVAAEQSRSATFMAASALAEEDVRVRKLEVSAAKSMVCRYGRAILEGAIQLHGGIGITDEYELSRYVRRMLEIEKTWGDAIDHEARFAKLVQ